MANTIPIRRPIQKSPVKLILYITGIYPASEKVVIVILLARIGVALISVTYVLVVQFVHHMHGNTNKPNNIMKLNGCGNFGDFKFLSTGVYGDKL